MPARPSSGLRLDVLHVAQLYEQRAQSLAATGNDPSEASASAEEHVKEVIRSLLRPPDYTSHTSESTKVVSASKLLLISNSFIP